MIVVSLDEGGKFENTTDKCMLIGGAVFRCKEKKDTEAELRRLERFFKGTCEKLNAEYPFDLHYNWENGRVVNSDSANKVKEALFEGLPDFLRGRGAWAKDGPNGIYDLYAMVGDENGIHNGGSNLIDDAYATNRYEHMVYRTVNNLLFFNPLLPKDTDFQLELATRVVDVKADPRLRAETEKLGHSKRREGEGSFEDGVRVVTDASSFRAALEAAIIDSTAEDARFEIHVQSINYGKAQYKQGFLYLADTLCSLYQEAVKNCTDAGAALKQLYECCSKTAGERNIFLWAYHSVDVQLRQVLEHCAYKRYFDALLLSNEIRSRGDAISEVYSTLWLSAAERGLTEGVTPLKLQIALEELDEYLHLQGEYRLIFAQNILDVLKKQFEVMQDRKKEENDRLQYQLYKVQMTIYNHQGDFTRSLQMFELCRERSQYVPMEEYLGLQNLLAVALLDADRYDEAMTIIKGEIGYHEMLIDIKKEIYPDAKDVFVSYGRALSQLGQCYAYRGEYEDAKESLIRSVELYGDSVRDIKRTVSYLLHTAIEMKDRKLYEEWAGKYFGCTGLNDVFSAVVNSNGNCDKFGLYVFIKAVYYLYRDEVNKKDIRNWTKTVWKVYTKKKDGHPWEFILKYFGLLWACKITPGGDEESDKLINEAVGSVERKGILERITDETIVYYDRAKQGDYDFDGGQLRYMYR